jgi:nucleotide-binding universal stress UspA family protein
MKKILVPTDFSIASKKAIDYAVTFAEVYHSKIVLVHAYAPLIYDPAMLTYIDGSEIAQLKNHELKKLEQEKKKIAKRLENPVTSIFVEGMTKQSILTAIQKSGPQLVVMGTTGASALEKSIFGSISLSVVNDSHKSVLVVPEKAPVSKIKRIVFATDYHENDIKALSFLIDLAEKVKAKIDVVHIANEDFSNEYEKESMNALKEKIEKKHNTSALSYHVLRGDKIATEIEKYCRKSKANLLALSRESRSFFTQILIPSITKKMIYHSEIPLLVFGAKD